jgi:hypothetical protein
MNATIGRPALDKWLKDAADLLAILQQPQPPHTVDASARPPSPGQRPLGATGHPTGHNA